MATTTDNPTTTIDASRGAMNGTGASLRYPSEIGRYYTIFTFVQYSRNNPKLPSTKINQADIVLPLPANLTEYYNIMYGDQELGVFGGALNTADKVINDYISGGGLDGESLKNAGIGFSQALARRTANFFSSDLSSIIDVTQGTVINPHITSVFKGVALREHHFEWKLHAKDAGESATISSIINYFRDHMHPTKKSPFLLNFPDEVYVRFFAEDTPFLHTIYRAQVTSAVAERNSEGTKAFFKGTDEPVIVNFTVTLKEVEALTREDFTQTIGTASTPSAASTNGN